ncbi:hypothetical protein FBU30_007812 [Linnemannia zychae]|nr:hypothetical protein FBU30_007812 [Linnemannia zychae]
MLTCYLLVLQSADVATQLAVLSDDQLINDIQLHAALLQHHPDILIRLLELDDLYVQFAAYRLVKATLSNCDIITAPEVPQPVIQHNQQRVIRELIQKLINVDQNKLTLGRVVLELFHGLLKDHRHLIRHLNIQETGSGDGHDQASPALDSTRVRETKSACHVATLIVQELKCSKLWELETMDQLLDIPEMQYSAIVFMIDLEKAYMTAITSTGLSDIFVDSITVIHDRLVQYIDERMLDDKIGSLPLKKQLELIYISLKPTLSQSHQQRSLKTSLGWETSVQRPLKVLIVLSPIMLYILTTFKHRDPDLEEFSGDRTTFILPIRQNTHDPLRSTTVRDNPKIETILSNPEAIRQLGQICFTAILSILESLAQINIEDDYLLFQDVMDKTYNHVIPFLENWMGDRTLPLLLTTYGEDDEGISWLLNIMSRIYRKILDIQSIFHHYKQSNAMIDLSHTPHLPAATATTTTTTTTTTIISSIHLLDKIQNLIEKHVHPVEAMFLFLETVGFDYQTVLDLLLTLDDHESGGMLAALMLILRSFTEDLEDQQRMILRWQQKILLYQQSIDLDVDTEDESGHRRDQLELLIQADGCLAQLSFHIQQLYSNRLFPYNPRPLIHVLDRTHNILVTVLENF